MGIHANPGCPGLKGDKGKICEILENLGEGLPTLKIDLPKGGWKIGTLSKSAEVQVDR